MITTFGEIMLRISPEKSNERIVQAKNFRIEPGGSESNVAIALSNLGMETCFVTCLPENELAQIIVQQLRRFSVNTDHIIFKGNKIGTYWTETGLGPRSSFVIYDREHSAFSGCSFDDFRWPDIFQDTSWFHFSGISPAVSACVSILLSDIVDTIPCPYSVDLNFREKLWNWLNKDSKEINKLMTNLCGKATLIAGNETDFQNVFGINNNKLNDIKDYAEVAKTCFKKFKYTQYIAISKRSSISATINHWSGYLFVRDDEQFAYNGIDYCLDSIQDRVGTGDSFVAGIIYGLNKPESHNHQEIIDFAVTLSALNHTSVGDASFFDECDVLKTLHNKGTGRIIR